MVCKHVETHAQAMGIEKIYLLTDTAEHLYRRLGWTELQRLHRGKKHCCNGKKIILEIADRSQAAHPLSSK